MQPSQVKDPLACKCCGVPDEWRLDHYGFLECGACGALDIDTNEHEPDDESAYAAMMWAGHWR